MDPELTFGPQARGSAQALAALRALNEWNCPALRSEICALARLTETDAMLALLKDAEATLLAHLNVGEELS